MSIQNLSVEEIRAEVKKVVAKITEIEVEEIGDQDAFVDDLELDSLSLMEIGVELDYTYKIGASEERLQSLRTVQDAVELVQQHLAGVAVS